MKKTILILAVLVPWAASANAQGLDNQAPTSIDLDLATLPTIVNICEDPDRVQPADGRATLFFRLDFGGDVNGVHRLESVSIQGTGYGIVSGDEYRINLRLPAQQAGAMVNNQYGDHGMVSLTGHIELINLTTPGSGVSQLRVNIVTLLDFSNGVVVIPKVQIVEASCIGRR